MTTPSQGARGPAAATANKPHPHAGACGFCLHWSRAGVASGQPGRCRAPEILPRVVDIHSARTDPALCGPRGRYWTPNA